VAKSVSRRPLALQPEEVLPAGLDGGVESREAIIEVPVDGTIDQLVSEALDLFVEDLLRKVCRRRLPEGSLGLVDRRTLLRSFAQTFLNSPASWMRERSKVFAAVVS
jgi:hypothetical protein